MPSVSVSGIPIRVHFAIQTTTTTTTAQKKAPAACPPRSDAEAHERLSHPSARLFLGPSRTTLVRPCTPQETGWAGSAPSSDDEHRPALPGCASAVLCSALPECRVLPAPAPAPALILILILIPPPGPETRRHDLTRQDLT